MGGTVKTRIQLKYDTEVNWRKAINFRPLTGEIIIYATDESHPFFRLKAGDGIHTVTQLPFIQVDDSNINIQSTSHWNIENKHYIPKLGEIIIYTDGETYINEYDQTIIIPKMKVGDGTTYVADLPFLNEKQSALIREHINNNIVHITNAQRNFWNNKLNCQSAIVDETLILNRN